MYFTSKFNFSLLHAFLVLGDKRKEASSVILALGIGATDARALGIKMFTCSETAGGYFPKTDHISICGRTGGRNLSRGVSKPNMASTVIPL